MDLEEITDNKSIANQINIEAITISTLASSLKTEHGINKHFGSFIDKDEAGRVALEKAKEYGKVI